MAKAAKKEPVAECRLYLVTPQRLDAKAFAADLAQALDAGDVACVQLRLKDVSDDDIKRACDVLRPVAQDRDVAFILHARPDLAAAAGCDGVHIGQDDSTYEDARLQVGANAIVGVTCHDSRHLAMDAGEAGADYVAFGAFFPTTTKDAKGHPEPEILEWWSGVFTLPCVAIGGITPDNCGTLVKAGADFLAVLSAVWQHPDGPGAAVKLFNAKIAEAKASA